MADPQSPVPDARPSPCYACLYRPRREPLLEDSAGSATSRLRSALFPTSSARRALNAADHSWRSRKSSRHATSGTATVDLDRRQRTRAPAGLATPSALKSSARPRREVSGACRRGRHMHSGGLLAHARPGLTVVPPGEEAAALAPLPLKLGKSEFSILNPNASTSCDLCRSKWGIRTLGAFAALPADLSGAARAGGAAAGDRAR